MGAIVAYLRWLAKHYVESKANRDAASGTDMCLNVTKLLLSNVEKIQIEASVTLAYLTHSRSEYSHCAATTRNSLYSRQPKPNASNRLQRGIECPFQLSHRKLCRAVPKS
jgi:hypothetical protein